MAVSSISKEKFEDYDEFIEKFKHKKTTDDCYTPPEVYEVIKKWVIKEYHLEDKTIVRPFYPGGDYENYNYPENCVVIDNPPFSILSKIKKFYNDKGIKYFLFAPHLTLFPTDDKKVNYLVVGSRIIYENGAVVNTSFVHNFEDSKIRTCPELYKELERVISGNDKKRLKYGYPQELITATRLDQYIKRGIEVRFNEDELIFVRELDAQKEQKKRIFGAGFLTNKELEFTTNDNVDFIFELSEREKRLLEKGGRKIC